MNERRKHIPYLPIRTVVKFYENDHETNANVLMTKTLMKMGFIDNDWLDQPRERAPQPGEFWLVDVVHETSSGRAKGCFLLHPIRQVESGSLNRLLPGMYTEAEYEGLMVLEPTTGGISWILPLTYKHSIKGAYAVIVKQ